MTCPTALTGGTVVTPDRTLSDGTLTIVGERIDAVGTPRRPPGSADTIDVSGKYVLPGLVDIHSDDIERYLFPRPEEQVPVETALRESERAALTAGVTTKFHAIAFEDTPEELRSIEMAQRVADAIGARQSCIDARVHARCELGDDRSVDAVRDRVADDSTGLVSLMNHTGEGQYDSPDALSNRYGAQDAGAETGLKEVIQSRTGMTAPARATRQGAIAEAASDAGIAVASHDDADAAAVERAADHGVDICEFPLSMAAARRAATREMPVVMGAPNLVRGGSLWDNLDARAATEAGLVDVFCSDFRPQTLLRSAFVDTGDPLHERVNRITSAPADAVGLTDRGRLAPGHRADVLVVDPEPTPTVSRAFVGGEEVYRFKNCK